MFHYCEISQRNLFLGISKNRFWVKFRSKQEAPSMALTVTSWNIAAINNNPWEYWITYDEASYVELMKNLEIFVTNPAGKDVPVEQVFTPKMFDILIQNMKNQNWDGLEEVTREWNENYKNRKIISQFITDKTIGVKRLTSMPDRLTNTINIPGSEEPVCRPSVINIYSGDLSTTSFWFDQWLHFFFNETITLTSRSGEAQTKKICDLLVKIQHAKYPAISEEEEKISIPLQLLCLAIFDCILVHIMNTISPAWQTIRQQIADNLNKKKVPRTCEIIHTKYPSDIICLQEAGSFLIHQLKGYLEFPNSHFIVYPEKMDNTRDQNSIILLKKSIFDESTAKEISEEVIENVKQTTGQNPVVAGDLCVVSIKNVSGVDYFIASFHGDTNGLATIPVLNSLLNIYESNYPNHKLIYSLDANSHKVASKLYLGVAQFTEAFVAKGVTSCFGDQPDPDNYTTFNARTFLQAQLSKATKSDEIKSAADRNLKDYVLFKNQQFKTIKWLKDNTGNYNFIEDIVFPTLFFPSDHAILHVELEIL